MLIALANIAIWMEYSRNQGRLIAWAAIGAVAGVYLFFRGFRMLQFKRLILNTPLSKIRSASMGMVELSGMAVGPTTIPAGITGDPCYYYRATAWEREQTGGRSQWKRVADESLFVPFFVQDDTGRMLVNAQGADMDVHRNFKDEFGGSFFGSTDMPPGTVENFLLRNGISGRHVRLEEYCIKPDYPLFVLGTLGENHVHSRTMPEKHVSGISSSINLGWNSRSTGNGFSRLFGVIPSKQMGTGSPANQWDRTSKSPIPRPSQMATRPAGAVASSWSSVSMDEVHPPVTASGIAVATSIAQAREAPEASQNAASLAMGQSGNIAVADMPPPDVASNPEFDLNAPAAIGKGDASCPFTISSESQRELVRMLGWKSTACIWGGPALTVTCVYILLLTLGGL